MAASSEFAEWIAERIAPLGDVVPRRMFGGYGIYIDGVFCAIVHRDTLYLKADEQTSGAFVALGAGPFKPFRDRPMTLRYYEVPAEILEDAKQLIEWTRTALAVALRDASGQEAQARRPAKKKTPGLRRKAGRR